MFSYFDDAVRPVGIETKKNGSHKLEIACFERQGANVYVLWFSEERPGDKLAYEPITVAIKSADIKEPVWVDLLTGSISEVPRENVLASASGTVYVDVPCYDSPALLTERRALRFNP